MTERLSPHVLGYRIIEHRPGGPLFPRQGSPLRPSPAVSPREHASCPAKNRFVETTSTLRPVRPPPRHGGSGNNARVMEFAGRKSSPPRKTGSGSRWPPTSPSRSLSCGYVGRSDGWTDLAVDYPHGLGVRLGPRTGTSPSPANWTLATDGNSRLGLAFGDGLHNAVDHAPGISRRPLREHRERFARTVEPARRTDPSARKGGRPTAGTCTTGATASFWLTRTNRSPAPSSLRCPSPGAKPRTTADRGGYHLVWTRDMVSTATGLLAAGNTESPCAP